MKVRLFVSGSAVLLATWLGVTYVRTVPFQGYPQLGRGSLPISAKREIPKDGARTAQAEEPGHPAVARAGD